MDRVAIINRIGNKYNTANIEGGEYSYVAAAGSKAKLTKLLGHEYKHYKLDIRFEKDDVVVLVETKQDFTEDDESQLEAYLEEERAVHKSKKVICVLANTTNDKIKVWQSSIDEEHVLPKETVLDEMDHYIHLFELSKSNDRERVLRNTYKLNEMLHKKDIDEKLRSQFVGTILLHIKKLINAWGFQLIGTEAIKKMDDYLNNMTSVQSIRSEIQDTLSELLDGSDNKTEKINLLQKNVLGDQKVKKLNKEEWQEIFCTILTDIYKYIDTESDEGQDILNLFFIAFNKYTGKDKNQAFTPDHITDFMCKLTDVDCHKKVLDPTCGSGSFLVQAMVKELADARKGKTEKAAKEGMRKIKGENIYGIEVEEKAYGLSTTNMLIHSDGNSNIIHASCFDSADFIKKANPDIILMNPPYNAKPKSIPNTYKKNWRKSKNGKEDPTKGLVFIHFLSDVIKQMNEENKTHKIVKLAVLLPLQCAIGTSSIISEEKAAMLKDNTLEAVFSLPGEMFYPGSSVNACCMLFTLGQPHIKPNGQSRSTFFGYCKDDGFVKKKNLGRVEQFDSNGHSKWKAIEDEWLTLFEQKKVVDGKSAVQVVGANDEWLCEAYMKTDYTQLTEEIFLQTLNNYLSYLVKTGNYGFMEKIISRRKNNLQEKYYVRDLNYTKWKRFELRKLFSINRGDRIVKNEDYIDFPSSEYKYRVITASATDNSVDGFYNQYNCNGNCLISCGEANGMFTTWQDEPCWALDTVRIYTPKNFQLSREQGLYLACCLSANRYRFSYGRKAKPSNMYSLDIALPIIYNSNGRPYIDSRRRYHAEGFVPDWQFMEDYINSLPYSDKIK